MGKPSKSLLEAAGCASDEYIFALGQLDVAHRTH
jgi:hypothetical protein